MYNFKLCVFIYYPYYYNIYTCLGCKNRIPYLKKEFEPSNTDFKIAL